MMGLTPRGFVRFLDGRDVGPIQVGFLPGSIGAHLCTLATAVMLDRDYATKLIKKHRIDRWQFEEIQNTIDKGHCILEPPNKVLFLYVKDKIRPVIYTLIVKTDYTRNALWLVTFHRIKKEQFTKRLRPDQIIRSHVEDD